MGFDQKPLNKVVTCIFCSPAALCIPMCIQQWWAAESCLLAQVNCGNCAWHICAPICFSCDIGDTSKGVDFLVLGLKYFLQSILFEFTALVDGFYNCGCFVINTCKDGSGSYKDVTKQAHFLANKIKETFDTHTGSEPQTTFGKYSP